MQVRAGKHARTLCAVIAVLAASAAMTTLCAQESTALDRQQATSAQARALLNQVKAKLAQIKSLTVDYDTGADPRRYFTREGEMFLERPNRFRVEKIGGITGAERKLQVLCDGQTVTEVNDKSFVAYEKPVRKENFFLSHGFLVQLFFDPRPISFDPADGLWGRAISQFDTNRAAYDKDVNLMLLGETTLNGERYRVVEIRYNTARKDIRLQMYVGEDDFIHQVDTYFSGTVFSQKYSNFRVNTPLPPKTWQRALPKQMPAVASDPVRMGAEAPDFVLPGSDGAEYTMKTLLQGKKGMYVCTFDGAEARKTGDADTHLRQMRVLQDMKDKYEKQGLVVVAIVGGAEITPDLKEEMMLNWMPDISRFNYPILIDIDLERGIQGSAYPNFNLAGRNNILLDARGRVVFAAANFGEKVNQLALYQALAQIGFMVSAADLEDSTP